MIKNRGRTRSGIPGEKFNTFQQEYALWETGEYRKMAAKTEEKIQELERGNEADLEAKRDIRSV